MTTRLWVRLPPLALLRLLMRVRPLGLLYAGLPCDSMGFMSSSVHQRSALHPWGAPRIFVFLGNLLSCRLSILVLVGIARGVTWMLENPLRTAVDYLPPIQWLLQPHLRPLLAKWFLVFIGNHLLMSGAGGFTIKTYILI